MGICGVKLSFEIVSAVSAFAAAIFWFYASWIGRNSVLNTPIDKITVKQARLNSLAAFCAGIAALLQIVVTTFMPVCRAFA
jgi:uncharacterized membrane protein